MNARRPWLALGWSLLAVAIALWPLLLTPHVSDDFPNYSTRWLGPAALLEDMRAKIAEWLWSEGRLFVLSTVLKDLAFQPFEQAITYKASLLALNVGVAGFFAAYVRELTGSTRIAAACLLWLPLLVQFRDFHDGIVSFYGIFQLAMAGVIATLACHLRYRRTGLAAYRRACVAFFVVTLFLYEMSVVAMALVWLQERHFEGRRGWKPGPDARLLLVVVAVYVALIAAFRTIGAFVFSAPRLGYGMATDPLSMLATFGRQVFALLPFSYATLRPLEGNYGVRAIAQWGAWWESWAFFAAMIAFAACGWRAVATRAEPEVPPSREMSLLPGLGAALVLLPAAVIATVQRYQSEIKLGNGYSVVYLQMFGAMLLLGWATARTRHAGALVVVVAVLAAGNLVDNEAVARALARAWEPQYPWAAALRSPQFSAACGGKAVVPVAVGPWGDRRVIQRAGFRVASVDELAKAGDAEACVLRLVEHAGVPAATFQAVRASAGRMEARGPMTLVVPLRKAQACESNPGDGAGSAARWQHGGRQWALIALPARRDDPLGPFELSCDSSKKGTV